MLWLQRDFGLYVVNLFDTHQAACTLQLARHSLAFLLHHYCQIDADKQFQLADWRIRPLPQVQLWYIVLMCVLSATRQFDSAVIVLQEMIDYGRADTHYLLYIYDRMRKELIEKSLSVGSNLLMAVIENSKQVALKVRRKHLGINH